MCGIAGILSGSGPVDRESLTAMRDAIAHRGPDDCAQWISPPFTSGGRSLTAGLAHRRLSILDLSACGRQPMANEDGTVQTVFNGEIYNFAELRDQLKARGHVFASHTDTEVLVHGYEEWGEGLVARLHGMFAFAVWDQKTGKLLLARDRFGIKPLFYALRQGTLLFASELKSLLTHPLLKAREIDQSALYDYLTHLYIPAPKTAWRGVHKFPPAHFATLSLQDLADNSSSELKAQRYWDIDFDKRSVSLDEAAHEFETALGGALQSHLMSDVPLGVFLSGGLDSGSAVALLRNQLDVTAQTFTASFDAGHSEAESARQVAEKFGAVHHETTVSLGGLEEALDNVVSMYDEPFGDGSAIPTEAICRFARQSVKVVLAGDGGDETLAGYSWYANYLEVERREAGLGKLPGLGTIRRAAPDSWKLHGLGRKALMEPLEHYARMNGAWARPAKRGFLSGEFTAQFNDYDDYWNYRRFWRDDLSTVSRLQYMDMHTYLPDDILTKVDRASMKHGLEVRVPFLDAHAAETFASWPLERRHDGRKGKLALREAMAGVLPDDILQGKKRGFSSPWKTWLTPDVVAGRLKNGALAERGWLSPRAEKWAHSGEIAGGRAWALLVLDHWLQRN